MSPKVLQVATVRLAALVIFGKARSDNLLLSNVADYSPMMAVFDAPDCRP